MRRPAVLVATALAVGILGGAGSAGGQPARPVPVTAVYSVPSAVFTPLFVGVDEALFRKYGIDLTLRMANGAAAVAAVASGEAQILASGGSEVVDADLGGDHLVLLAALSNYPVFSLYVAPDIRTPQDLAGKKVAVDKPGTSIYMATRIMLTHYGLWGKVQVVTTGGGIPGIIAAVERGLAAGGTVSPPSTAILAARGYHELVNGVVLGVPLLQAGISVERPYLEAHRETVENVLRGFLAAWRMLPTPAAKPAVVRAIQHYTRVDAAKADVAYRAFLPIWAGSPVPTVRREAVANELAYDLNPGARAADPSRFVDNSVIERLAR